MIFVDSLIEYCSSFYFSSFIPQKNTLFCQNGFFEESGIIENMAQTAALGVGYDAVQNNKPVPLGFIGAIKNLSLYQLPKIENTISTKVTVLHTVLNASIVKAEIFQFEKLMAEGELKIFLNPLKGAEL
jgi:predicted hotdog family 3-hydroxylacyl-ACP dehydratase